MRILAIDTETSGLDPKTDRVLEIGIALWDTERRAVLATVDLFLTPAPIIPDRVRVLTGIDAGMVDEFGFPARDVLETVAQFTDRHRVEWLLAHNADFDRGFLAAEVEKTGATAAWVSRLPWIDTLTDLPFRDDIESRQLTALCAEHGFINPWRHRAVFDALSALRLFSCYDVEVVLERARSPRVELQALVSFDDNRLAKDRRYQWRPNTKQWVKTVKECDVLREQGEAPFKTRRIA